MHIDKTYRRAYNIEPNMCWECYSCVKACPQNAIDARALAFLAEGAAQGGQRIIHRQAGRVQIEYGFPRYAEARQRAQTRQRQERDDNTQPEQTSGNAQ